MKSKLKVPKGWNRIHEGTLIKAGDKVYADGKWTLTVLAGATALFNPYIRRNKTAVKHKSRSK